MKFIGGFLLAFSCGLCGIIASNRLVLREQTLKSVYEYFLILENEMRYSMKELPSILFQINKDRKKRGRGAFYIENGMAYGTENITKEDIKPINSLICMLGKSDIDSQLDGFEHCIESIKRQIANAEEERKSKEKINVVIGFSVGIIGALLLV